MPNLGGPSAMAYLTILSIRPVGNPVIHRCRAAIKVAGLSDPALRGRFSSVTPQGIDPHVTGTRASAKGFLKLLHKQNGKELVPFSLILQDH